MFNIVSFIKNIKSKKSPTYCKKNHWFFERFCFCQENSVFDFKTKQIYAPTSNKFFLYRNDINNIILKQFPKIEKNKITIIETNGDYNSTELKKLAEFVFNCFDIKEQDQKDYCLITTNKQLEFKTVPLQDFKDKLIFFNINNFNENTYTSFTGFIEDICKELSIPKENMIILPQDFIFDDDLEKTLQKFMNVEIGTLILESFEKQFIKFFHNKKFQCITDKLEPNFKKDSYYKITSIDLDPISVSGQQDITKFIFNVTIVPFEYKTPTREDYENDPIPVAPSPYVSEITPKYEPLKLISYLLFKENFSLQKQDFSNNRFKRITGE